MNFISRVRAGVIALPEPLKASLTAVVIVVISVLFANIVLLLPILAFLEPFKVQIAIAAAMTLINYIQKAVPDAYEQVAIKAIEFVLALLMFFGIGQTLAAMGALPALLAP